ncbi:hypothetical protein CDL18_06765 [Mediterraneibacter gnavus]|uniref:Uncharacterized protein n=1 Tax=Mediterraneibacter gnavus TaxID=33038 RepID=A0A2N5NJ68_MEDGN|nr:hypothetical protein CDL22_08375 [Mediterraneibacter gnavus]PLT55876.1 hypothetical protein CDL18_06765 [Mediterraneibacter gnavus]
MKKYTKIIVLILVIVLCAGLFYLFQSSKEKKMDTRMNGTKIETEDSGLVTVFEADFSGAYPSDTQFYSWEGREYGK